MLSLRCVVPIVAVLVAAGTCPALTDEEDIKERLDAAKGEYQEQLTKYKAAVVDLMDKREEKARAKGDKKLVEQALADRKAFDTKGDPPAGVPDASKQRYALARSKLDKSYADAVKEFVRLKRDDLAGAAEKDRLAVAFASAGLLGRKTPLTSLKAVDVKVWKPEFSTNGMKGGLVLKIRDEPMSNAVYMHAVTDGTVQANFTLAGKWSGLRTGVGVPRLTVDQRSPVTPLTFEVLGDGKSLWKSKPVTAIDEFQVGEIRVEKVKVVTLQIHCPGRNYSAWSYYIDPILIE